ncbi:hypothetical protein [Helicobacter trogontum]|uniref:hypothetical protein n=1 Tax=Helicobacter trogontum TaxID=50960 RepID=UPI000AFDE74D|nr:hypothetical protein [Helicobacter trogontum]
MYQKALNYILTSYEVAWFNVIGLSLLRSVVNNELSLIKLGSATTSITTHKQ